MTNEPTLETIIREELEKFMEESIFLPSHLASSIANTYEKAYNKGHEDAMSEMQNKDRKTGTEALVDVP